MGQNVSLLGDNCLLRHCRRNSVLYGPAFSALPGLGPVHPPGHTQPLYLGHGDMLSVGPLYAPGGEEALYPPGTQTLQKEQKERRLPFRPGHVGAAQRAGAAGHTHRPGLPHHPSDIQQSPDHRGQLLHVHRHRQPLAPAAAGGLPRDRTLRLSALGRGEHQPYELDTADSAAGAGQPYLQRHLRRILCAAGHI